MTKKEHTTITELFQVLDLLESLDMQFWLDGGWGVDVLYGQQTRLHRDIDIDLSTPDNEYEHKMFPLNIILDTPKTFVWQQEYLK